MAADGIEANRSRPGATSRMRKDSWYVGVIIGALTLASIIWATFPWFTRTGVDAAAHLECERDYARARTAADTAAVDLVVRGRTKAQGAAPVGCGVYRRAGMLKSGADTL